MKTVILILSFMLAGCYGDPKLPKDPHWQYEQHVNFDVPEFYRSVCDGQGTVIERIVKMGAIAYRVQPDTPESKGEQRFECYNANNSFLVEFERE